MKFLLALSLLLLTGSSWSLNCTTPFNEPGICTPWRKCTSLAKIIIEAPRPLKQNTIDFLKNSTCEGGQRLLCCRHNDIAQEEKVFSVEQQSRHGAAKNTLVTHRNINLLDTKICGPINVDRIAHGNETYIFELPWMALLGYDEGGSIDWKCGGTVINRRYVLTAAHCVVSRTKLTTVRLGEYDISTDSDCMFNGNERECTPPVQDLSVEREILHPDYQAKPTRDDIALLRLATDADFSKFAVAPICLPVTEELKRQTLGKLRVTGWGTTETQYKSNKLLKADVNFVEKNDCESDLRIKLPDGQFCAKGSGLEDPCKGDSGGPLQYPAELGTTRFVQFGLVSYGVVGCGNSQTHPDVFTDIRFYLDWILDNLEP